MIGVLADKSVKPVLKKIASMLSVIKQDGEYHEIRLLILASVIATILEVKNKRSVTSLVAVIFTI